MSNDTPDEEQPLLQQSQAVGRERFWFGMNQQLYGYFLMSLSSIGFSVTSFIVHILSSKAYSFHLPSVFLVWFRSVFQFVASVVYLGTLVENLHLTVQAITRPRFFLLVARGLAGTFGFLCFYGSLARLPLGDGVTIFFLAPLFTVLLAAVILGEPVTLFEAVASVISFVGVAMIAKPEWSAEAAPVPVAGVLKIGLSSRSEGVLLALFAAVFAAVAYTLVRKLGGHIHFMYNVLALGLVATILTTVILWDSLGGLLLEVLASPTLVLLLMGQGCGAFTGQIFLTKALQHCGGLGVMIRNIDVPLSYLLGIFLLGEVPSWLSSFGALLVLFATGAISFRKAVRS